MTILYIQRFWELVQRQRGSLEPHWREQEEGRCGQEQIYNMGDSIGSSPCWVTLFWGHLAQSLSQFNSTVMQPLDTHGHVSIREVKLKLKVISMGWRDGSEG